MKKDDLQRIESFLKNKYDLQIPIPVDAKFIEGSPKRFVNFFNEIQRILKDKKAKQFTKSYLLSAEEIEKTHSSFDTDILETRTQTDGIHTFGRIYCKISIILRNIIIYENTLDNKWKMAESHSFSKAFFNIKNNIIYEFVQFLYAARNKVAHKNLAQKWDKIYNNLSSRYGNVVSDYRCCREFTHKSYIVNFILKLNLLLNQ